MRRLFVAIPAVLAIGLMACGGGNDNEGEKLAATPKAPAAKTVNVTETEYKLDPSDPKVKKGLVTFKATNRGKETHSLEVEGPSGEAELEKELKPGQSGTLKVKLSKPGKYEWYCPVDGHKALGMKGEVTVGGGGASTSGGGRGSSY